MAQSNKPADDVASLSEPQRDTREKYGKGKNPNSLKNLRLFQTGQSGHPGRPPKDCSLTSIVKAELDKVPQGEKQGRTWRELLVLSWMTGAMHKPVLMKELLDRVDGKALQQIDITSAGEKLGYDIKVSDDTVREAVAIVSSVRSPRSPN